MNPRLLLVFLSFFSLFNIFFARVKLCPHGLGYHCWAEGTTRKSTDEFFKEIFKNVEKVDLLVYLTRVVRVISVIIFRSIDSVFAWEFSKCSIARLHNVLQSEHFQCLLTQPFYVIFCIRWVIKLILSMESFSLRGCIPAEMAWWTATSNAIAVVATSALIPAVIQSRARYAHTPVAPPIRRAAIVVRYFKEFKCLK